MKKGSSTKWLLEANQQAGCYKDLADRIKGLKLPFYAFVMHDDEQEEKGPNHYHAVLEFPKAVTFEEVQTEFEGAHIEVLADFDAHMAYLLHKTPQAIEDGKKPYEFADLLTNNKERAKRAITNGSKASLDPNHILDDIESGCTSITKFILKYKPDSVKPYMGLIKEVLRERQPNREERTKQLAKDTLERMANIFLYSEGPRTGKYEQMENLLVDYYTKVNGTDYGKGS